MTVGVLYVDKSGVGYIKNHEQIYRQVSYHNRCEYFDYNWNSVAIYFYCCDANFQFMSTNYQEKKRRVIAKLEDSGYDSIDEWADAILTAIGQVDSDDADAMDIIQRAAKKLDETATRHISEQQTRRGSLLDGWD